MSDSLSEVIVNQAKMCREGEESSREKRDGGDGTDQERRGKKRDRSRRSGMRKTSRRRRVGGG